MNIAPEIKAELTRRSRTQGSLAAEIGLSRQALTNKMTGRTSFTLREIEAIAAALGTTAIELMSRAVAADQSRGVSALAEPSSAVDVDGSPAMEARGIDAVERVGAALAGVPAEDLLAHEQACDSCWSLDDAARHLSGDEDPATHRSSDEEVA